MAITHQLHSVVLLLALFCMKGSAAQDLINKATAEQARVRQIDIHRGLKQYVAPNPCDGDYTDNNACEYETGYGTVTGFCCKNQCQADKCDPCAAPDSDYQLCTISDGYGGQCCKGECKADCPPPDPCAQPDSDYQTCTMLDGYQGTCCKGECKAECPQDPCEKPYSDNQACTISGKYGILHGVCCKGKCKSSCKPLCGYKICKKTQKCCNKKCVDLKTDPKNCGKCSKKCPGKCVKSKCVKKGGYY